MRRTRRAVVIVAASGVLVWDDHGQRVPVVLPENTPLMISNSSFSCRGVSSDEDGRRRVSCCNEVLIDLYSRCESVYHASDRRTVAFAEYRQANALTEAVFHL